MFQTPNWPQTYPENISCEWFIQLPSVEKVVEITCEDDLYGIAGAYPECTEDYITIYDGHSFHSTTYGPYCEFTKPGTIKLSSNLAKIEFYAGPNHACSLVGVKCSFQSVDAYYVTTTPPPVTSHPSPTTTFTPLTISTLISIPPCLTISHPPPTTTSVPLITSPGHIMITPLPSPAPPTQCGGLMNTSSGTFQTPNWPETYPVNIDCEWKIQLPNSKKLVKLRCDEDPFGIAGFLPDCDKDFLKVYNGHSKQDIEFGPFCHYEKPITMIMSSNKAMAIFHAGPKHNAVRKGFKCLFQSTNQCGGTLTAVSGFFQTPDWPQTYPVNINCTWKIVLPDSSKRVKITFETPFGIAGSFPACIKDKLYVYDDQSGTEYGPYCYFTLPNPPIMTSNQARVVLLAGPAHNPSRVGFRATYHSIP